MSRDAATRVVGTTTVVLRPLRYLFDVETDVAVVSEEDTSSLPFDVVHVHLRAATRPPLMERDELLNGFLRADTVIHSSAAAKLSGFSTGDNSMDKYKFEGPESKDISGDDDPNEERMLSSLRGTFIWILVRIQPIVRSIIPDTSNGKNTLRVQYQLSPASESYCLPIDHTNVVKLLVTDELLDQVDTNELQFNFLSVPLTTNKPSESKHAEAQSVAATISNGGYNDAALAASAAAAAEEVRRRQRVEDELAEAKSAAQAKDRERLDAQLQAKRDAERAQELELAKTEQTYARSLLEKELATREQQNQDLKQARQQLEDQLRASNENAQRFQVNITSTDQALELLRQRAASDAKEREELQRRLRMLEEEKMALQNKSRACLLQ